MKDLFEFLNETVGVGYVALDEEVNQTSFTLRYVLVGYTLRVTYRDDEIVRVILRLNETGRDVHHIKEPMVFSISERYTLMYSDDRLELYETNDKGWSGRIPTIMTELFTSSM